MRDESKIHYSQVDSYSKCPYKRHLEVLYDVIQTDNPSDPLIIGSALHLSQEYDFKYAEKWYYGQYNIIGDKHIEEMIKLEYISGRVRELIRDIKPLHHEFKMSTDDYEGTIDLITSTDVDKLVDIWDLKYSNHDEYYNGMQLNIYAEFLELTTDYKVRHMNYIMVPKTFVRRKNDESETDFRKRMMSELEKLDIRIVPVERDKDQVKRFAQWVLLMQQDTDHKKCESNFCDFCKFKLYCKEGFDYMLIPKNEPVPFSTEEVRVIWLYAPPTSGKTVGIDGYNGAKGFPYPLNINTDGNTKMVHMPRIKLENQSWKEGRVTKTRSAWEMFLEVKQELMSNDNGFETLVVDLIEDVFQFKRNDYYDKNNIEHESDNSTKFYDIIRNQFLKEIMDLKSIKGIKYLIFLSHQDTSSDMFKKSGDKITKIKPNLTDKVATKLAGLCDIVGRITVDGDDSRWLEFKSDDVVFGGGRLNFSTTKIPWTFEDVDKLFNESLSGAAPVKQESRRSRKAEEVKEEPNTEEEPPVEEPRRARRSRTETSPAEPPKETTAEDVSESAEVQEPERVESMESEEVVSTTRRRRRKSDEN